MSARRGLVTLLAAVTLLTGITPVAAQVEEANERADDAASELDDARRIVTSAVEDRDAVEAALLEALDRYQVVAGELTEAHVRLDELDEDLAIADAESVLVEQRLAGHTVTAYMHAVTVTASLVLDTGTVEDAILMSQTVRESQVDALTTLADLVAHRAELERLRSEHGEELARVSDLEERLADDAATLEELFAAANDEVAAAYAAAAAADAAYRSALQGVERAIAEEEAARRAAEATTTTTTTPTTTSSTSSTTTTSTGGSPTSSTTTTTTTTTTTEPPGDWPPIPINPATLAWRPLVEQHFAADLVLDALVIIECESNGDPDAVNPWSGASGLFQFMPGTWAVASVQAGVDHRSVFDGEANIIAASWLAEYYRDSRGEPWRPWVCRKYL